MSTSPLPPDPYTALDVPKDADEATIKKAHRKLVLKYHPDRIKDPALVEQGKTEFQKVQQAYELLIDPSRRQRYDDEVKLAQLRRERMEGRDSREPPPRPTYTKTTYAARPSPAPTQPMPRETPIPRSTPRDEYQSESRYSYEDRVPDSYFDIPSSRYEEPPLPRGHPRKESSHERRTSTQKVGEKKEDKKAKVSAWEKAGAGFTSRAASSLKAKANQARESARESVHKKAEKVHEKMHHAKDQKTRDKDERRERTEKQAYARYAPRVDDHSDASSESDIPVGPRRGAASERSPAPSPKARRQPSPEPPRKRQQSPRPRQPSPRPRQPSPRLGRRDEAKSYFDDEGYGDSPESDTETEADKWERLHRDSRDYIAASQKTRDGLRPTMSRQNSADIHKFWTKKEADIKDHRRSGSDSDRARPDSSHKSHRRSGTAEYSEDRPRPPLPTQSSAPAGIRKTAATLDRDQSSKLRQNSYDARDVRPRRRDFADRVPQLTRAASDQMHLRTASRRDTAPLKGSSLKQTETNYHHDSTYSSGSSPQSPETRGDSRSPPRESRERDREPRLRESKTTYRAQKDPMVDGVHRAQKLANENQKAFPSDEDGGGLRKWLSPDDIVTNKGSEERHEQRRSRSREAEIRSTTNRPQMERRPSVSRNASSSRHEEKPTRPKLFGERSPERSGSYMRKVDPKDATANVLKAYQQG
ncbi:hypothetical protein LTS08_000830 [Lithohypha guttulata]|nr:hypothetical protein LTS08_000830 [Lithohypha guttulata]